MAYLQPKKTLAPYKGFSQAPTFTNKNGREGKVITPNEVMAKVQSVKSGAGFTLIELLVVVSIMVILTSAMVINLAGQRAARDVKIAQNQLVSSFRQAQSNTLSSKLLPNGQSAQYYLIKFDLSKPTQYTIQAMYNISSSPQYLQDIQVVYFPPNIRLAAVNAVASVYPVSISRPNLPITQNFTTTGMSCAFAAFAAPFGKVFLNDGCSQSNSTSMQPYVIASNDDYTKIMPSSFVSNTDCTGNYGVPFGCTASINSSMVITLTDVKNTVSKKVLVNGITGTVCPTQDNITCLASN